MAELPVTTREYLDFIASEAGCPLVLASIGARRDETIVLGDVFGAA